jgi:dihydropteroate synthase
MRLFAGLSSFADLGLPLVVGISRKSMFGQLLGLPVERRLHAGIAAASIAVWLGARIIRTHDVGPTIEAVRFAAAARAVTGP